MTHGMQTMGDVAAMSAANPEGLYRLFGVNAEILIDHAWGIEPVRMSDIKAYRPAGHSFSTGQVLPRPYRFEEALLVFREMAEQALAGLVEKRMRVPLAVWWVSFDPASLEENPGYSGPVTLDFYLIHGIFVELFGYNFLDISKSLYYIRKVPLYIAAVLACTVPAVILFRLIRTALTGTKGRAGGKEGAVRKDRGSGAGVAALAGGLPDPSGTVQ